MKNISILKMHIGKKIDIFLPKKCSLFKNKYTKKKPVLTAIIQTIIKGSFIDIFKDLLQ